MDIKSVELLKMVVNKKNYPPDNMPEFCLLGRSNVGKSSFINSLLNRKKMAYTSGKPGKTQTLNFYLINESFRFVDVPGYGYAKVSKEAREKFGKMIEEYLTTRESLKQVFLLIDARHTPTEDDVLMYDYLKYYHIPVTIIATKIDKVNKTHRTKHINRIIKSIDLDQNDMIIPFSAISKQGTPETWKKIQQYL